MIGDATQNVLKGASNAIRLYRVQYVADAVPHQLCSQMESVFPSVILVVKIVLDGNPINALNATQTLNYLQGM